MRWQTTAVMTLTCGKQLVVGTESAVRDGPLVTDLAEKKYLIWFTTKIITIPALFVAR